MALCPKDSKCAVPAPYRSAVCLQPSVPARASVSPCASVAQTVSLRSRSAPICPSDSTKRVPKHTFYYILIHFITFLSTQISLDAPSEPVDPSPRPLTLLALPGIARSQPASASLRNLNLYQCFAWTKSSETSMFANISVGLVPLKLSFYQCLRLRLAAIFPTRERISLFEDFLDCT